MGHLRQTNFSPHSSKARQNLSLRHLCTTQRMARNIKQGKTGPLLTASDPVPANPSASTGDTVRQSPNRTALTTLNGEGRRPASPLHRTHRSPEENRTSAQGEETFCMAARPFTTGRQQTESSRTPKSTGNLPLHSCINSGQNQIPRTFPQQGKYRFFWQDGEPPTT
jgi:hypothetical protein